MSCGLPAFTADGVLPPADYPLTLDGLRASHLMTGDGTSSQAWNAAWRASLVDNLAILVGQLWQVGITEIFIDGSFVEERTTRATSTATLSVTSCTWRQGSSTAT